jgi:hypothetical protein
MAQKITIMIGLALLLMVIAGGAAAQDPLPEPELGSLDLEMIAQVDLASYPLLPEISANALAIYESGIAQGNNPRTFIKVGDCMTDNPNFLNPIGAGDYALGDYEDLQYVIDQYIDGELNSFDRKSQAAAGGFNAASVLDALWANPQFCEAGETPLACEVRVMKPSVALVMFGTNDTQYLTEDQFDFFMRSMIVEIIRNGTLPIMSTFPYRPEFPEKSVVFNQIIVQIAEDYDVPLINLWLALEELPNRGIDEVETTHMSAPEGGAACYFIGPNLEAGFTMRNLMNLQALDALLLAANDDE